MRRVLAIAAVATLALSTSASAQRRAASTGSNSGDMPIEAGMDAALIFGLGNNSYTSFTLPVQQVRVGFFVSPELSIEPVASLNYRSTSGSSSSDLNVGVGALYHFSPSRTSSQVYVRPFIGMTHSSASAGSVSSSSNDGLIGAGLGIKMPWIDRFAWRFEGNLMHSLSSGGGNAIGILAGLSYFTK